MTPSLPGEADEGTAARYSGGMCHVFAVALHRRFGWTFHVVLDQSERFWEDPDDSDNWIPAAVHVYAVDGSGTAWDVHGARPLAEVEGEACGRWNIGEYDWDEGRDEGFLSHYVCGEDDSFGIDRPLPSYGQADVDEADRVAAEALRAVPGYPSVAGSRP